MYTEQNFTNVAMFSYVLTNHLALYYYSFIVSELIVILEIVELFLALTHRYMKVNSVMRFHAGVILARVLLCR